MQQDNKYPNQKWAKTLTDTSPKVYMYIYIYIHIYIYIYIYISKEAMNIGNEKEIQANQRKETISQD